ncbi:MAG: nickel pincer cofactor biosynthesis protein LarC [Gemmatimonadetes bacterium]|nr:nickel pincer cofactor biosynthesis protein LarC [Gemmatimonadota bacterium]
MTNRMDVLLFDPFAGISGDMTVAALLDLGLEEDWLRDFVGSLGFAGVSVRIERVKRRAIACPYIGFEAPAAKAHRHLHHVLEIVDRAPVPPVAREWARDAFERIAHAEAEVHGTTIERVHFHEVGALDSILDVVCVMAGIEHLGFRTFFTRPVAVGSGWIEIEHGRFPVPAPATLKLLDGFPLTGFTLEGECTTPTGAAILATLTHGHAPPDGFVAGRSGFGAGTRDPGDRPNCLRLIAGRSEADTEDGTLVLVQADVDDLAPEYVPPVLDALLAAGALDAVAIPAAMKKGRPGLRIEALADPLSLDAVVAALFAHSPTIGVRHWPVTRPALGRAEETVVWRGQTIRRKRVMLPGGGSRAKPEYEDVLKAAKALDLPAWRVRLALEADDVTN